MFIVRFVLLMAMLGVLPAMAQPVPLVFRLSGEQRDGKFVDSGPFGYDAVGKATVEPAGRRGPAMRFDGVASRLEAKGPQLDRLVGPLTYTCWLKLDRLPKNAFYLVGKGFNSGLQLSLNEEGRPWIHGNWGGGWYHGGFGEKQPVGGWQHWALTLAPGDRVRVFVDGRELASMESPFAAWPVTEPFLLGNGDLVGLLDEVSAYAVALTPEQLAAEAAGTLATRPATDADFPTHGYPVRAALARWDQPLAYSEFDQRRRQTAERRPGPDAVDWPKLELASGARLFEKSGQQFMEVPLASGDQVRPLFRHPKDETVVQTGHWFRALPWIWGQHYVYTTDTTARTSAGDWELWTWPVRITGQGDTPIQSVRLTVGGQTVYDRTEPLHSLTLLLPANAPERPWELSVNGSAPNRIAVGLAPVVIGQPEEVPLTVELTLPGGLRVATPSRPEQFADQKAWDDELKASTPTPTRAVPALARMAERLGSQVPRSPLSLNMVSMSHGMSSGAMFESPHTPAFRGTPAEYAAHLADMGFDRNFETLSWWTLQSSADKYDAICAELAQRGVQSGFNVTGYGSGAMEGHANMALFAATMPEWNRPLQRDYQLVAQRFEPFPNFGGIMTGADNAGYVSYWDWAPPIPNRPWGRAMMALTGGQPKVFVGPAIGPQTDWQQRGTQRQFLDHIARYDATFGSYGTFAKAVAEVDPQAPFVIGSYGSSPGVGGRGGWPWATIPSRPIHAGLPILQAYDWNELSSSMPLHNVALIDRLRSDFPGKPCWTIIDNFGHLFGREARQRAYALALTRGVTAVGTNFLAHTTVDPKLAQDVADQKELHGWLHRYGGVYAMTRPLVTVGVLYSHEQAISRPIVGGDNPSAEQLLRGSHEGKTTEALFLCHAAGYPARIVTVDELRRGLPADMKALLLVGLNRFDQTWVWHEGLAPALKRFSDQGGKLLVDDESDCPAPAVNTGLKVACYIQQAEQDQTPVLLARNASNIALLQNALRGVDRPVAESADPTLWALPTQAGEVQYLTVANWAFEPGRNASRFVRPRTGQITWHTDRPIYDVRAHRKLTPAEAETVDLTKDGFAWYALPPTAPTAPRVTLGWDDGWAEARLAGSSTGLPVELTVSRGDEQVTLSGATGQTVRLPVRIDDHTAFRVQAKELLTGLSSEEAGAVVADQLMAIKPLRGLAQFAARRGVPVVIALTPAQAADAGMRAAAERVRGWLAQGGRQATLGSVAPAVEGSDGVVLGLQPYRAIQRYPQWRTVDADLVLFGTPSDNPLLADQARGGLLPTEGLRVTWSPFVGERWVLNVNGADPGRLLAGLR